eukprot:793519-Rhodomonas_salina.1
MSSREHHSFYVHCDHWTPSSSMFATPCPGLTYTVGLDRTVGGHTCRSAIRSLSMECFVMEVQKGVTLYLTQKGVQSGNGIPDSLTSARCQRV